MVPVQWQGRWGYAGHARSWGKCKAELRGLWEGGRWGVGLATTGGAEVEAERPVKKSRKAVGTGRGKAKAGWLAII